VPTRLVAATIGQVLRLLTTLALAAALCATAAGASPPSLLHPKTLNAKAPASYTVVFNTTKGTFKARITRSWAPRGADRFYNLVKNRYYDGVRFFRVVPGFVVQYGIHPKPKIARVWQTASIKDDPVKHSNGPWTMTFATAGPDTRTTQIFINLVDNASLDSQGFAPFAVVTHGRKVVAKLYSGYREQPTSAQQQMVEQGDAFVRKHFPKLDRILTARIGR
jgi:peptidyl-prolyl cis-trans isomerase A (cyclophilin A)